MPDLPVDPNDIYSQFGVSPNDYQFDAASNTIKRRDTPLELPVEMPTNLPVDPSTGNPMYADSAAASVAPTWLKQLTGTGGEERYQTWPERMIRSGSTIAGDVASGAVPIQSPNGYPGSVLPVEQQMEPNLIGKALGIGNFTVPAANSEIGRAQDMAGMAGMSSIPLAEKGALGSIGGKFYSSLENTIANSKVQKTIPEQWTQYLRNQPGVKPEELEFSGINDLSGSVTKDQLLAHVQDNGIKLGEVSKREKVLTPEENVRLGELDRINNSPERSLTPIEQKEYDGYINRIESNRDRPKYSSYQLPGGENYRELLLTKQNSLMSPEEAAKKSYETFRGSKEPQWEGLSPELKQEYMQQTIDHPYMREKGENNYQSSHWDEPNVLAHIRMNDRDIPGVGKTLHVEEIQSDWHQAGRKSGYDDPQARAAVEKKLNDAGYPISGEDARSAADEGIITKDEARLIGNRSYIPNAPFKKTWDELALKRVLTEAVNKGYDAVSWTPGEAQAARYDLSKQVKAIRANPNPDGTYQLGIHPLDNQHMRRPLPEHMSIPADKLPDIVGKELAEKIIKGEGGEADQYGRVYRGLDLKVGGEGMKAFYDKMLVDKANALVKKMGGKVEKHELSYPDDFNKKEKVSYPIRVLKITPQMREQIQSKGFPLYSSGIPTFTPVDHDPHKMTPINYNPFLNPKAM